MKNSRTRHWVFFILLIVGYVGLEVVEEVDGFWKWLALGLAIAVFTGEAYYLIQGKDLQNYCSGTSQKDKNNAK